MLHHIHTLKAAILAVAILLGLTAIHGTAHAAPLQKIVLAGGCFWCVEADFEKVDGVKAAISGFAGGTVANPSYKQVVRGGTGHYEVVEITYDPDKVSYEKLLNIFFRSIDPTDAGGQFCDRGDSYRSAIFVSDPAQKAIAEAEKSKVEQALGTSVATMILPAAPFYPAEEYHQDYYNKTDLILTRFGPKTKAEAYKLYRNGCGRDQRLRQLWGNEAGGDHS